MGRVDLLIFVAFLSILIFIFAGALKRAHRAAHPDTPVGQYEQAPEIVSMVFLIPGLVGGLFLLLLIWAPYWFTLRSVLAWVRSKKKAGEAEETRQP